MTKLTMKNNGSMAEDATSISRPALSAETHVSQLAKSQLDFDAEELLLDARASEVEQCWLDQCSRAVSRHEEGDAEGAALRAKAAIEDCLSGSALRFSVFDDFAQCIDICIDSARFHAEEALLDISGDPFAGTLRHKLTEGERLAMARKDIMQSFEMISTVASALGGKPAEVLEGVATAQELVPDAGLSQLASIAGGLSALCDLAGGAIADEAASLEQEAREVELRVSDMGLDGFAGAVCATVASQRNVQAQSVCLIEECGELIQAVSKYLCSGDDTMRGYVLEEMVDVEMMMGQVQLLLGISGEEFAMVKLAKALKALDGLRIPVNGISGSSSV